MTCPRLFLVVGIIFIAVSFAHANPKTRVAVECIGHCANQGVCVMIRGAPACYCLPGWQGERCEEERLHSPTPPELYEQLVKRQARFTQCLAVPDLCKNGGLCQFNESKFTCACPFTYVGKYCEIPSPCLGYCQNGGLCIVVDEANARCDCNSTAFAGFRCQVLSTLSPESTTTTTPDPICLALASIGSCVNGTCQIVGGQARCQCQSGVTGSYCIANGATVPTPATVPTLPTGPGIPTPSPSAIIPGPTTSSSQGSGTRQPGDCRGNPCRNSRPCYNNGDSYFCYCGSLYSGINCEFQAGK